MKLITKILVVVLLVILTIVASIRLNEIQKQVLDLETKYQKVDSVLWYHPGVITEDSLKQIYK